MTLEKFDQKVNQAKAERENLSKKIAELTKREAELSKACAEAASSGNAEKYIDLKAEAERVNSTLFVKRSYLDKIKSPVTEEEAREAWESYAAKHNADMQKALNEYAAERSKLLQIYAALIEKQSAAYKVKEHICSEADIEAKSLSMIEMPIMNHSETGAISGIIRNLSCDPDFLFYISAMEKKAGKKYNPPYAAIEEIDQAHTVAVRHLAK